LKKEMDCQIKVLHGVLLVVWLGNRSGVSTHEARNGKGKKTTELPWNG